MSWDRPFLLHKLDQLNDLILERLYIALRWSPAQYSLCNFITYSLSPTTAFLSVSNCPLHSIIDALKRSIKPDINPESKPAPTSKRTN